MTGPEGHSRRAERETLTRDIREAVRLVERTLGAWEGTARAPHRWGGTGWCVAGKELGRLHPSGLLDVPLSPDLRNELVGWGAVHVHHSLPESAWVSVPLDGAADARLTLTLLGWTYERLTGQHPAVLCGEGQDLLVPARRRVRAASA